MKMAVVVAVLAGMGVWGQGREGGRKVIVVAPMVGKGTAEDPRRPMFVAARPELEREAAVDFWYVLSDDGKSAIVEFTLARPNLAGLKKLDDILGSKEPGVKAFERGRHGRAEVEAEMKKAKKDFDLEEFGGGKKQGGQ